jgi:segregation and condensation protein B
MTEARDRVAIPIGEFDGRPDDRPDARPATSGGGSPPADARPSADTGSKPAAERVGERPAPGELTEAGLEALLFVAERPLSRREIGSIAGVDAATVDARLGDLEVSLNARGIRLLATGDRVELATAPEAGALVARYVGADAVRLSPAGLETLAIVAYRQPVTRAAVERIRGVDSDHTLRSLLHRRLVVELGRSAAPGRPILYGTAFEFLERFGLQSLDDLPTLDADVAARLSEEGGVLLLPLDDASEGEEGLLPQRADDEPEGG